MSAALESELSYLSAMQQPRGLIELIDIFEPESQITVVGREPDLVIDAYLAAVSQQMGEGLRITLKAGSNVPHHLLPAHIGSEAFAADLTHLAEVYTELLGCSSVGLRLEVMHRAMCPRFHIDHVGIRLLCTYRGPATEWLEDACADRSKLEPYSADVSDENSGIILNRAGIHRIAPYAIALLKGSGWQGNAGRGLIHRSPAVPADAVPRVLVALDALW